MENLENLPPRILQACRSAGARGVKLIDIIGAPIPEHTGAAIIGGAIYGLLCADLIKLEFRGRHFTSGSAQKLLGRKRTPIYQLNTPERAVAYEFADRLKGREQDVVLRLGDNFSRVQEILGFSLTEMMNRKAGAVFLNPVFSAPTEHGFDVFVIMPFADEFRQTFERAIKPACQKRSLNVGRGDDLFGSRHIISDIWSAIYNSRRVIADCTGKNANVFYELGIAHAVGRHAILITQSKNDIPFDLQHWRFLVYEPTPAGLNDLTANLDEYLREDGEELDADSLSDERASAAARDEERLFLEKCDRYAAQGGLGAYTAALKEVLDYCDQRKIKIQPFLKRDEFFDFTPFLNDENVVRFASAPDHRTPLRLEEIFYAADKFGDQKTALEVLDRIFSRNQLVPGKEVAEYLVRHRRKYAKPVLERHLENPDDHLRAVIVKTLSDLLAG